MAYVIAAPCIDHIDQSCVEVCPVDAISGDPGFDRKFHIDPSVCIDCGACEPACPNAAIFRADRLPAEYADYALVDTLFFRDPSAARSRLEALL
jgi:ferredoxin